MDCSTAVFPVHQQLSELAQTHVHWIGGTIQPSYPLSYPSPSPPASSLSQHQGLVVPDLFLTIRLFHVNSVNSWFAYRFHRRQVVWTFFGFAFCGIGMKTDIFKSCGHCWVFQICWRIECSTLIALSFRIWNISAGVPSPPLALLVVMLPKAHLTSHFRMFGSRWMTTPSGLSGPLRPFFGRVLCILVTSF